MAEGNKSLGRFRLSGIPPAPRGVPQVQVSFDIDANGLLQVSATDRTTGRQQSVTIQGGSNLSEQEIEALLSEAEAKAAEDRRRRATVDRRNRAQTLIAQAERRLRDAALELGPYGAERQQRAVELAVRDVQDLLAQGDDAELELAVSQLQDSLFGLNRRLLQERRAEAGPLQGLKNTLGSLKDELFSDDDDWDDWNRDTRADPWSTPRPRDSGERSGGDRFGNERWRGERFSAERGVERWGSGGPKADRSGDWSRAGEPRGWSGSRDEREPDPLRAGARSTGADRDDPWERREATRERPSWPPPGREEAAPDDRRPVSRRGSDDDPRADERQRRGTPSRPESEWSRPRGGFDDDPWRDV